MNRDLFHVSFPWCGSTMHTLVFARQLRIPDGQRTSKCAHHFPTASARRKQEHGTAYRLRRTLSHRPSMTFCRNPPQGTSKSRPGGGDKCRSRSEEHTSELQSPDHLVCRLLLEKKKPIHSQL